MRLYPALLLLAFWFSATFKVEVWENKTRREVARSTTIGAKKILTFPNVSTGKVRISILAAKAAPRLCEVQVFLF